MCGICGKIDLGGGPVDKSVLRKMTASLVHRGPDDEGLQLLSGVGLGHRRLSIIDLSAAGHQPMCNEDGTVWIVCNGEIYNFHELRQDLISKGHVFRSASDTETIIHLYEDLGTDCLRFLRGMFAFAIWDERDRSLFLARDRLGKKPLYYCCDKRSFWFGSEIKAIIADTVVPRTPDLTALHHYLTYQAVPSPWTAFEGIKKLPPSHCLVLKDNKIKIERYWNLVYLPKHTMNVPDLKREIVERLREAVRVRLISDVPLGAFLSGGIDSSAIVAMMSECMNGPVKTFSIGFREKAYNELAFARSVAAKFKTEHKEYIVKPDAAEVLQQLVWHYNEPFADPSAIPTYYVSKLAREHVTVILNGDGGDENFAGYGRYAVNEFARNISGIFPRSLATAIFPFAMAIPHGTGQNDALWGLKRFLQEYSHTPEMRNAHWLCHFTSEMKAGLYTEQLLENMASVDSFDLILEKYREADAASPLDRELCADVMMYLPDVLLAKVDVASMANSLEVRSPFLDHEFMEFVARIPAKLKLKGRQTKFILKEALREILPNEVLFRPKMGFGVPLDYWFRNELREMSHDILLNRRCIERGYFKEAYVRKILDEHVSGKWNWQYHIYNLLMLELWHRMFIDG